jgi:hypothetical protein
MSRKKKTTRAGGNRGSGPRGSCAVWPSFHAGPTYVPIY